MVIAAGEADNEKSVPAPFSTTVCVVINEGVPLSLSVITIVPVLVPTAEGVKLTVTKQLVLTARVAGSNGQVVPVIRNSGLSVLTMLVMLNGAVPTLETWKLLVALVVVTGTPP